MMKRTSVVSIVVTAYAIISYCQQTKISNVRIIRE